MQQSEGVQLTTYDGVDYFPMTQSDISAGSPVMFVPSDLIITSNKIAQEFPSLQQCENQLISAGLDDKIPLFRIFYKIIAEYEKGDQSQWVSLYCKSIYIMIHIMCYLKTKLSLSHPPQWSVFMVEQSATDIQQWSVDDL